ncbi:MAG: hypothetical protein HY257_09795, partial [Chloroflexi bacterium]|nr:hypothetical protein [Chloroflexota bacterium]
MKQMQLPARKIIYRLAQRRTSVAIGVWFFFALVAIISFFRNSALYGAAYLRDWIELSGYVTDPILIALLVYIALRAQARGERAANISDAIVAHAPIGIFTT